MSRAFSTAAQQLKKLGWTLNGTTADVAWAQRTAEKAVDKAHGLGGKVDSGVVQGNPHPTPKTGDPYHCSITIGKGDVKGKNRVVSAHVYPDGTVAFSKDFGTVKVERDPEAPEGDGSAM
ncbi:hypothetical protein BGW36DRAFT_298683 [Talaromyces proteolyticus]|uniref:Uncharacterized protein n=1 Tax=Talaromyces proteolyticus TaxID=1131652 RepID=A0AAD4KN60_9EURO|nr:uncharacterized protein BGW36DRAFT_298683 [Talaromyces proteolyticus]KAH8695685.1 hypothetical protein BGW36DRAFT_298683 [Talaromyces proteolyticus]